MDPFARLARALNRARVRFVVIGVSGADYYARSAGLLFTTQDWDLFLPPDPRNALRAWRVCERSGLELWLGDEPLDLPLDSFLAERVVARLALVQARSQELQIDLARVMKGFEFEKVWRQRRIFARWTGSTSRSPASLTSSPRRPPPGGRKTAYSSQLTRRL